MAYTTLATINPGDSVAVDWGNAVKADIEFFLSGFATAYTAYEAGADYTTTSATFGDVDATNLKLTMTVKGGRAFVFAAFHLTADNTANSSAEADIIADSLTRAGGTNGLVRLKTTGSQHVSIVGYWSGLSDGSHTFKLQFRNVTAGATTTIEKTDTGANVGSPIIMAGIAW